MKTNVKRSIHILLIGFLFLTITCTIHAQKQLSDAEFKSPPGNVKIHTWWHWLDGNITKEGITKRS